MKRSTDKLTTEDYHLIGMFLDNTLGDTERQSFIQRLENDDSLRNGLTELQQIWNEVPSANGYFNVDVNSAFQKIESKLGFQDLT